MMQYYRLIISYDGTDYAGWQSQKQGRTIQSCLKEVFFSIFSKPCQLRSASRTDAGVHALRQVVALRTTAVISAAKLMALLNMSLPVAIQVVQAEQLEGNFNPHAKVHYKVYQYRIFTAKPTPFNGRFGWYPAMPERVNWPRFIAAMALFVGKYNFFGFVRIEPGEVKDTLREVSMVNCHWVTPHELLITIQGPSFLRYQIRRMIGAAFELARKPKLSPSSIEQALINGTVLPSQLAFTAPASGLCLLAIHYLETGT